MIRKILNRVINWAQNYGIVSVCRGDLLETRSDTTIGAQGMTFTLYSASGGHIVEYRSYDTKSDERINNLHIITNDQDIGERIGQIVTMELLRKH
jgi:cystathionine beta-lyase family protein involved in aluminum resistance